MSKEIQRAPQSSGSRELSRQQNSLIGDWIKSDTEYAVALTYGEKQIGDFTREDMTRLVEAMAMWRHHLGVTSDPTEQELIVICQFVYDNFKWFTIKDIKLAMNWSISGRIDVGFVTQKNISSYYVSRALNAYSESKRRIFNDMMERRENHLARQEAMNPKEPTPLEKANHFREYVVSLHDAVNKGGIFYDPLDMAYNWLKVSGQLNLTKEQIEEAVQHGKAKAMEKRNSKSGTVGALLTKEEEKMSREEIEKKLARQYIVQRYLEDTPLGKIIERIKPEQFKS